MDSLRRIARREADILDLPPELLANRRAMESLLISELKNSGEIPAGFQGWRFDVITGALLDCIHEPN